MSAEYRQALGQLLTSQPLAVLATCGPEGIHASLVAFRAVDDLRVILLATAQATRKFINLQAEPRVALLIDNRSNEESDFHAATAATAHGVAAEVTGEPRATLAELYLERHPHLREFVASPTTALIRVQIEAYSTVRRFQNVFIVEP